MSAVTAVTAAPGAGDGRVHWDMRRDMDPIDLLDVEERLQRDPSRPFVASALPDPRQWSMALAGGVLEILAGVRPLAQLRRWVVPQLYTEIDNAILCARGTARPATACVPQSAHVWSVRDGVVEICVTVRMGARLRVVAMRLEDFRGRWLATAMDVG